MTLTEFLLARIAEDEAAARAVAEPAPWVAASDPGEGRYEVLGDPWPETTHPSMVVREDDGGMDRPLAEHIARHDPARVLAECEAKRRIVGMESYLTSDLFDQGKDYMHEEVLRALALPYTDHPDYRDEWRP